MSVDRQALFSGAEAPPPHLALDLDRLGAFLQPLLPGLDGALSAAKFKGGQSNPTYLLTGPGARYVLRRKPPGVLVASAHAIDREYGVLEAMVRARYPAPKPYLYCADAELIGSEFYIAEFVDGRVFWDADMPGVEPSERGQIYADLAASLAQLHDVNVTALGLEDLGSNGGYIQRNLARWSKIYGQAKSSENADMDWLIANLPRLAPHDEQVTFIHGDFGLYNVIIAHEASEIRAVLDWEMATLGDPLIDLAHHLRAWWDPPDDRGAATTLVGRDLVALGIPSMDEHVARYCAHRGIAVPDMTYYLAHAQFRYACMIQGILKRGESGAASSRTVLHRPERVAEAARLARQTLERKPGV